MRRILFLSRGGYVSGSQRQIYYVVRKLNGGCYEPIVVCPRDGQLVEKLRGTGVTTDVLRLRPWRTFANCLGRYVDAAGLIKLARRYGVAVVHNSDLWLNAYSTRAARRLGVPCILHVRTPISEVNVKKHGCDEADFIIAISKRVRRDLLAAGISDRKITVIDDAVDTSLFNPRRPTVNVLRRDFAPSGRVLVGLVGRVEPLKRQLALLKTAQQIVRGPRASVTFFIIGQVHRRAYFKKLSQFVTANKLGKHVIFTGRREDMPAVLKSLDVLVSFSGGSVMFEAMACGIPVISAGYSTREDSVHIQDGRTGFLVTSTNDSELVPVLTGLIEDSQLRSQVGTQASLWAQNRLSCDRMVEKTIRVYERLVVD
jgi:glycosyltransferase involved in cell wall biosynthesis